MYVEGYAGDGRDTHRGADPATQASLAVLHQAVIPFVFGVDIPAKQAGVELMLSPGVDAVNFAMDNRVNYGNYFPDGGSDGEVANLTTTSTGR